MSGMLDKVRESYARLERGERAPERAPRKVKLCRQCPTPAWSEGLCPACLMARGRAVTQARKEQLEEKRRLDIQRLRRAARTAGDMELWRELGFRRQHGHEYLGMDTSPDALWRKKWRTA